MRFEFVIFGRGVINEERREPSPMEKALPRSGR